MSGGVRWAPGGGYLLPALIPPEPLSASTVWGMKTKCSGPTKGVIDRRHGKPWFSGTLVIGDPQENGEKSEEFFNCVMFF